MTTLVAPGKVLGIALGEQLDLVLPDGDRAVADLHILAEPPEHGVVLEQVRHGLRVAQVVGSDDLEVTLALQMRPEKVPPDAPESVDPNPCLSHVAPQFFSQSNLTFRRRGGLCPSRPRTMNFADEPLEIVMASAKPKPDFERERRGAPAALSLPTLKSVRAFPL